MGANIKEVMAQAAVDMQNAWRLVDHAQGEAAKESLLPAAQLLA